MRWFLVLLLLVNGCSTLVYDGYDTCGEPSVQSLQDQYEQCRNARITDDCYQWSFNVNCRVKRW